MKRNIIWLVALVIVLFVVSYILKPGAGGTVQPPGDDGISAIPATTTIQGTFVCLPHRDTSGPQTMECAFGLKSDRGDHYALDFSRSSTSAFDLPMDRSFRVTGLLVPIEAISTDHWQKYDVEGIMQVSSYEELVSGIPSVPVDTTVTLELNKPVIVASTTIRVTAVTEDSRCSSDVVCIQAGRVVLTLSIGSPSGPSVSAMEIGDTVTTETLSITLDEVRPYPMSSQKTQDAQYRFVFTIESR